MGKRGTNGMGSVRRRPNGSWEGRYSSPDGVQRSVYAKTQKECTQKLKDALRSAQSADWRKPCRLTLAEWAHTWLEEHRAGWNPATYRLYETRLRLHILPVLGQIRLEDLTAAHVRRMLAALVKDGRADAMIRGVWSLLRACLNAAVADGLLAKSPLDGQKPPKGAPPREMHIVDRDRFPAFVSACERELYGLPLLFALLTGLRLGELRGLLWEDLDEPRGLLHVRRQLTNTGVLTAPKDGSARDIYLPAEALRLLRRQRTWLAEARLAAGAAWPSSEPDYIFRARTGNHLHRDHLARIVARVGESIGLPGLHPHDLRHSYAVAALRAGTDVKTVQHNLGHATAAMTLDVYAAYTTDAGQEAARRLSAYWQENAN